MSVLDQTINFLLSFQQKDKILKREENVNMDIVVLLPILNGVISIPISTSQKLHDMCFDSNCSCQKQFLFTPKQFHLGCKGFKSTLKEKFKGTEKTLKNFLEPALNKTSPQMGMAVSAKTRSLKKRKLRQKIQSQNKEERFSP